MIVAPSSIFAEGLPTETTTMMDMETTEMMVMEKIIMEEDQVKITMTMGEDPPMITIVETIVLTMVIRDTLPRLQVVVETGTLMTIMEEVVVLVGMGIMMMKAGIMRITMIEVEGRRVVAVKQKPCFPQP